MCLLVCLPVCLSSFYRPHDICPLCGAASEWPREQEPSSRAAPRAARATMHIESTRAHAVQLLNEKIAALMPFKNKTVRARMLSYTSLPRFSKKGKKKTNMPLPKFSLQFAFSWSVYFSNRTEPYSSQIEFAGPHGITENQATYLHLTQSRRLRHLNGESFRSVRQVISCCFTTRNFSWSESVGGLISSSNRAHGPRNCSQEGSRTALRFAIQVNRDGRSNCSQLGSRPSPANKPCLCRGDSRRSSGQTRRRSASDGCRKGL